MQAVISAAGMCATGPRTRSVAAGTEKRMLVSSPFISRKPLVVSYCMETASTAWSCAFSSKSSSSPTVPGRIASSASRSVASSALNSSAFFAGAARLPRIRSIRGTMRCTVSRVSDLFQSASLRFRSSVYASPYLISSSPINLSQAPQ